MQKSVKKWIWIIVPLAIFIAISFFLGSAKPVEYPPYVSNSPSPTGLKALYTYLDEESVSIERWDHAPSLLEKNEEQLLLMVEPSLISEQAVMREYEEFMEAGNTILLFKNNLEGMFGISTMYGVMGEEIVTVRNSSNEDFSTSVYSSRILPEAGDQILLEDDQGAIAIKREYGNGNLIAVNSPDWLTNHFILEADNLNLVFGLMLEENWNKILIDEYAHSSNQSQDLSDAYPMWLMVAGLQIVLLTLLWLLYRGKRFGPIYIPREDSVRFSDERITALAAWYQKGKVYQDSLISQAEYLRLMLQEKWGIPYQKEWKEIRNQLVFRNKSMTEEDIDSLLEGIVTVLQKKSITKQEYLGWSKRIDRLRKEVEEG